MKLPVPVHGCGHDLGGLLAAKQQRPIFHLRLAFDFPTKVDSPSKSKTQPSAISLAVSVFGLTCFASSAAAVKATMKRRTSVERSNFMRESLHVSDLPLCLESSCHIHRAKQASFVSSQGQPSTLICMYAFLVSCCHGGLVVGMNFPGMDPYLEDPQIWPGVHASFIVYLRDHLQPQLGRRYIAAIGDRVFLEGPDREIIPDAWLRRNDPKRGGPVALADSDTPVLVQVPALEVHEAYVEILDRQAGQRVVTV